MQNTIKKYEKDKGMINIFIIGYNLLIENLI